MIFVLGHHPPRQQFLEVLLIISFLKQGINTGRKLSLVSYLLRCNLLEFIQNHCSLDYDPCFTNPCLNGGSCAENANGGFTCTCTKDFNGKYCGGNFILFYFIEILRMLNVSTENPENSVPPT